MSHSEWPALGQYGSAPFWLAQCHDCTVRTKLHVGLMHPANADLGDVDASLLCLWAVSLSLTHPRTGVLMNFDVEEPPLFDAVRERELQSWLPFRSGGVLSVSGQ